MLESICVYSSVPAEAVTIAILKYASFLSFSANSVYIATMCSIKSYNKCSSVQSAVFGRWHRPTFIFATTCSLLPCQWYVVQSQPRPPLFQVGHVATVVLLLLLLLRIFVERKIRIKYSKCVMETMHLVLRKFKNFLQQSVETWIRSHATKNN